MSTLTCPKCGQGHDGQVDSAGWATCRKCANCWQPFPPAPIARPATSGPIAKPVTGKPTTAKKAGRGNQWGVSDEYAPVESQDQPRTDPLTVRDASGPQKAIPVATPAAQWNKRKPSGELPADTSEFDSQLFERAEREAQVNRSQQETIAAPNPVPTPSTEGTTTCPVCGHRFSPLGREDLQRCPQCNTLFSLKTGDPVGSGMQYSADDGEAPDDLIGSTIRGCLVDRKLGEGGMGAVYHAKQLSLDRSIAIKVMPSELARNRNFIQRFEREAKSLARINHPNILHIYDFGEDQTHGIYFMIIEFVDGKDLGEILRSRDTITQPEALDIVRQALLALETASQKGVIHRDIKPDNLMIAKDGTCKVSDFGLAKGYGDFTEVTTAGVRVGTPAFMSPEQCDGGDIDARSDVYSLGCTAFLALTGHLPFNGDSPFSIMLKHKTELAPSLKKYRADADPRMDSLIQRMLAKRPGDRCGELRELIDIVQDLQVSFAQAGSNPARRSTGDRPRSLDDSGAVRLLPDGPMLPGDDADVPLALQNAFGTSDSSDTSDRERKNDLPVLDLGQPGQKSPPPLPVSPLPVSTSPPPVLLDDLPPLPVDRAASGLTTPRPPAGGRISTRARSVRGSGENPAPASVSSSSLLHVQKGDEALRGGRASEAIRQYNDAQKRRPSKEVGGKLADARKAQRHGDATALEQHGDSHAEAGRYDDAIDDWMRASQQYSQVARREDLLRKVAGAQRSKSRRRLRRSFFGFILLIVLIGVLANLLTPRGHAMWLDYQRKQALAAPDVPSRIRALQNLLETAHPYAWYATFFGRPYALPLTAVEADLRSLSTVTPDGDPVHPVDDQQGKREAAAITTLADLAADAAVPWSTVIERGESILKTLAGVDPREQATAIISAARSAVENIETELAGIEALRASGHHQEALARSAAFPTAFPRAGVRPLPVVGRLEIHAKGATGAIPELKVQVDGIAIVGDPLIFCRDPARPVVLDISATGYLNERVQVPPGQGETPIQVQLMPGLLWQTTLSPSRPWWRLEPVGKSVAAIGPAGVTIIAPQAGTVQQVFARASVPVPPALPNPSWTLVEQQPQGFILASSDGLVVRAGRDAQDNVTFKDLPRKGSNAVLGWLERELSFQPGRDTQVILDLSPRGAAVTMWSGPTQMWQIPNLEVKVAKPWLAATADRILVVDDSRLRVIDEDGSVPGGYALSGLRTGPVLPVADGSILAIPTTAGVTLLRIGGQPHYVQPLAQPRLEDTGPVAVAADRGGLVTGDAQGLVRLYEVVGDALVPRWQTNVPDMRKATGPFALSEKVVVVVDDHNGIHIFSRDDGRVLRSYPHPHNIPVAPLPFGEQLLVLDGTGLLTAYQLVE